MLVLKAVILGAVQGISEFFPISSSGHLSLIGNLLGVEMDLTFSILLHLGTLIAVLLNFHREVLRCLRELIGYFMDLYFNLRQFILYKGAPEGPGYRRMVAGSYRKMTLMLLLAMVPTVLLAVLFVPLSERLNRNLLCSGLGMLVTALLLLVTSFMEKKRKGPREARFADAVLIGAFQGFSAFPGISRFGMTLSAGFICGFSAKFNRLFAYLLFVPTLIGAIILEGGRQQWSGSTMGLLPSLAGMLCAVVVGYLTIRAAIKLISSLSSLRGFSVYCACVGLLSIVFYLV